MKSCPTCNRTFDDTLTFCLVDGSILSAPFDPQATQHLPVSNRTDAPTELTHEIPTKASLPPIKQVKEDTSTFHTITTPAPQLIQPPQESMQVTGVRHTSNRFIWIVGSFIAVLIIGVLTIGVVVLILGNSKLSPTENVNAKPNKTANISSVKVGKDEKATTDTATFGPKDKVYIVATLSNTSDKWNMRCRLYFDNVSGQKSGGLVPDSEKTLELESAGTATFWYTWGGAGWPNGKYKAEVTMINDKGEEKDKKTVTFTVTVGAT